jgi:Zn-dependent protease with chaperone function
MRHSALATVLSVPVVALLTGCASAPTAGSVREEKLDGYLEWRLGELLVVDGQRLTVSPTTRLLGEAENPARIPLGYEVKARGVRLPGGVIQAREIEAKPNGKALFEGEVLAATNEAEAKYKKAGRFFEETQGGGIENIGRLYQTGPQVERVRRITDNLIPPYLSPRDVRVYVIENKEWNAFAMGNRSIYVFSGLLRDLDDDEVAIVIGHELVHATHEHTRRQFKKDMWVQLLAAGVAVGAEQIDNETARTVTQLAAVFGAVAYRNGYGRDLEDQADRVGLRYAYQAGYDITKGPPLWNRFAKKYGEPGKAVNFFFGDHSLARERARNLEREIALNYQDVVRENQRLGAPARTRP